MVTSLLEEDQLSAHLFVFRNRDKLKVLYWDTDGLAIWYKRLEQRTFQFRANGKQFGDSHKVKLRKKRSKTNDVELAGWLPVCGCTRCYQLRHPFCSK